MYTARSGARYHWHTVHLSICWISAELLHCRIRLVSVTGVGVGSGAILVHPAEIHVHSDLSIKILKLTDFLMLIYDIIDCFGIIDCFWPLLSDSGLYRRVYSDEFSCFPLFLVCFFYLEAKGLPLRNTKMSINENN